MAVLPILHHPDPRLKKISQPIKIIDESIASLSRDMLETMYQAPGIGLAAPQVNRLIRMIVVDVSEDRNQPLVLINPKITKKKAQQIHEEGCLSVPGIFAEIERAEWIHIRAQNEKGDIFEMDANGMLSVCIQHEIDHLDGKLFVDYLSRLKQERVLKKLRKEYC